MADTTFIKNVIEPHVRMWLSGTRKRRTFSQQRLVLITGQRFEFDAVSSRGAIAACIVSNRARTRTDNENNAAVKKVMTDIHYLQLLGRSVRERLVVFTDHNLLELMRRRARRIGLEGIEFVLCPLPKGLSEELSKVLDKCSLEQRSRETPMPAKSPRHDWTPQEEIVCLFLARTSEKSKANWKKRERELSWLLKRGITEGSVSQKVRNFHSLMGLSRKSNNSKASELIHAKFGKKTINELRAQVSKLIN